MADLASACRFQHRGWNKPARGESSWGSHGKPSRVERVSRGAHSRLHSYSLHPPTLAAEAWVNSSSPLSLLDSVVNSQLQIAEHLYILKKVSQHHPLPKCPEDDDDTQWQQFAVCSSHLCTGEWNMGNTRHTQTATALDGFKKLCRLFSWNQWTNLKPPFYQMPAFKWSPRD